MAANRAAMVTAKLFQHHGSQAVLLPEAFRLEGTKVFIERRGNEVVLPPIPKSASKPKFKTLNGIARYLRKMHPYGADFQILSARLP